MTQRGERAHDYPVHAVMGALRASKATGPGWSVGTLHVPSCKVKVLTTTVGINSNDQNQEEFCDRGPCS